MCVCVIWPRAVKKDEGFEVTASDKIVHQETYEALPSVEGLDGLSLETPSVQPVRACVSTVHVFTAAVS